MKKIVLTGGHAGTTAYSVAEELLTRKSPEWDIYWLGAKRSVEGKNFNTLESQILPQLGIKSQEIITGRLQRKFTIWTIPSLAKIPIGILQSILLLLKIRPHIILSFGGFASFPVVIAGYILGIPTVLHDQTAAIGLANKVSARFAKTIILSREESKKYINHKDIRVLGNPIRKEFYTIKEKHKISSPPNIYVTGGSRGAKALNNVVLDSLEPLLEKYNIYHQTGEMDFKRVEKRRNQLTAKLRSKYHIFPLVKLDKLVRLLSRIDMYVSRAGANTVSEIMLVKRPAILVPLPFARHQEQLKNAQKAKEFGIAEIIREKDLSQKTLLKTLKKLEKDWQKMIKVTKNKKSLDENAQVKIADLLEKVVKK